MSGEGRSNLFVRSSSEEENGRISRTISLSSVQEIPALENNTDNGDTVDDCSYSSLSVPSKSKSKKKGESSNFH